MRLRHIEVIQATLQTGDIEAAARQLQLSRDATEEILNDAERQMGFLLFARVRGKLQPTVEARALQGEFDQLYVALERTRQVASHLRQHQEAPLRVMCTPTLAHHLAPQSLATLRRRFRDTPCHLASQPTAHIVRSLLLHESDLGLGLMSINHPGIHCEALAHGKLQLLAPRGWLPSKQKYIGLHELAGQAMVGLDGEDPLNPLLDGKLAALQPPPRIHTHVQTYEMMRSMVEAGEGLAIVDPFTALGAKTAGLDVCPISPAIPVTLFALTLSGDNRSPALRALLEIVGEKAQALLAG